MVDKDLLQKSYPPGISTEIDPEHYTSIVDMFTQSTEKYGQRAAFINMGKSLSYYELAVQARAFASYLQQELGLSKGDKFAIMVPNSLQYPIALFGALLAGVTVVNVNPLYTARELKHQLIDSETKAILIIENFAHTLEKVIDDTQVKHVILTTLGDRLGMLKGIAVNVAVKYVKKMVPSFRLANTVSFNKVLFVGRSLPTTPVLITGDDIAFLQYTGGTTGVAKGAMLTHRNMVANLVQARTLLKNVFVEGEELVVTALPLYHIFALLANCMMFMSLGGSNLLITNPRDMPGFVKTLNKYPFTAITGVNTLFNGLINTVGFSSIDFSHLKITIGGGMAVQQSVAEAWEKITETTLLEGYGLTECSPLVALSPYNQRGFSGAIGIPAPSTDIRIVKDDGSEAAIGEPGELLVKGPQVMQAYYKRDDDTADVIKDGWFYTGDVATFDEQGLLRIVDRIKDMIIVSGFNVYPNEIEDVVALHDGVLEVAAIGVSDSVCGENVKVFIVRKDPSLSEIDIINHCKEKLTNYKVPKLVEFREELPKTNVGKILRRELR